MGRPKGTKSDADQYDDKRSRMANRSREQSAKGRDIGAIPDIKDVRRRSRCRKSLRLFCETYNPEAFYHGWSADHLQAIARIEEAATLGALYAFAMPRGSGKTTICRMAALWAICYGLCRYVFVIGATAGKAEDTLAAIKLYARFLPDFGADFPEVSHAAKALGGIATRAAGQTCQGEPTMIEWSKDRIVLPTVPPPANWPKSWKLRPDGMAPTSGGVVGSSGLTGEGIRGSLLTLTTGESIRPDLVLLDDPQTRESACSPTQNDTREQLVSADVLGMAGPGRSISAVMPCTVIAPGDFIDRVLDRDRHPLWRGERTKLLRSMPRDLGAWDRYFEVYRACAQKEPPDLAEAHDHYRAHQAELDAGADASWPERKLPGEVSAVQHAMHLYYRDPRAFAAEYQNDPLSPTAASDVVELTADEVSAKLDQLQRGLVPRTATRLTAGIDVQGGILYWKVCAWDEGFGGRIADYGAFPRQNRAYFNAADARPTLFDLFPGRDQDAVIFAGLLSLSGELMARAWPRDGGGLPLTIQKLLVDSGAFTATVYEFCDKSPHRAVISPSKGRGIGARNRPMAEYRLERGEQVGRDWRIAAPPARPIITYDANSWKTFTSERLRTPGGSPGCLWLPGNKPYEHQLLADHLTSEKRTVTYGQGRRCEEWAVLPGRSENHWLDCLSLCAIGASVLGLTWSAAASAGIDLPPPPGPVKVSFQKLQEEVISRHGGNY